MVNPTTREEKRALALINNLSYMVPALFHLIDEAIIDEHIREEERIEGNEDEAGLPHESRVTWMYEDMEDLVNIKNKIKDRFAPLKNKLDKVKEDDIHHMRKTLEILNFFSIRYGKYITND
jgi:hypothetical protein